MKDRSNGKGIVFIALLCIASWILITGGSGCAFAGRSFPEFPDEGMHVGFQGSVPAAGELAKAQEEAMKYPLVISEHLSGWPDYVIYSDHVYFYSSELFESLSAKENIRYYVGEDGRDISTDIYEKAYPFHEGLACVRRDGKYGYINAQGEIAIPFVFEDAAPFMEGLAYYATPQEYGFMDDSGTSVFTLDCDSVSSFQDGLAFFSQDGKYGYLDQTGAVVIAPVYDYAQYFEDGLALVGKAGKSGMIDKGGKEIIPLRYDRVVRYEDSIRGYLNEDTVYYDREGQLSTQEDCEKAYQEACREAYEEACKDARESYSGSGIPDLETSAIYQDFLQNKLEELRTSSEYEEVSLDGDCFQVKKDGSYGYLNFKGEIVVPIEYHYVDKGVDYNQDHIRILKRYDSGENILIRTGPTEAAQRKDALLKNAVTPKRLPFWEQYLQEEHPQCLNTYRFFWLDDFGELILYQNALLHNGFNFPWSDSAFFCIRDGKAELLLSGYECGGSMRGDRVNLWLDQEENRILPGISGSAGGFGGYASYQQIYELQEGSAVCIFSSEWIGQTRGNYSEEYLLQNAELLYGDGDELCTKENVLEMSGIDEYSLNDKLVTREEYEKVQNRYVPCYSISYY